MDNSIQSCLKEAFDAFFDEKWDEMLSASRKALELDSSNEEAKDCEWSALLGPLPEKTCCCFKYKICNDEAVITGWDSPATECVIPSFIENKPVVRLQGTALEDCGELRRLEISENVTSIERDLLSFGEMFTEFFVHGDNKAFSSNDGVLFSKDQKVLIRYPVGRTQSSYVIPDGVTTIGRSAFGGNYHLNDVQIPEGVTVIGEGAFEYCRFLKSVSIPAQVATLGDNPFFCCDKLTEIAVDGKNTAYSSIEGVLFSKDEKTLIKYPPANSKSAYRIPESVTTVEEGAIGFWNENLKSITIPRSTSSISGLTTCDELYEIVVESGNPAYCSIDGVLFSKDMKELICYPSGSINKSYNIPDCVTHVGRGAFSNSKSLEAVTIPGSVRSVGKHAFAGGAALNSVIISEGLTDIGPGVFNLCTSLRSIIIPRSVASIALPWISNKCERLKEICVVEGNPFYRSVDGVLFSKDMKTLVAFPAGNKATFYRIPDGVTRIEERAFFRNRTLRQVTFPDSLTEIGTYAFHFCTSLTDVNLPETANVGYDAFDGCPLHTQDK